MDMSNVDVEPGQWYMNTEMNERCAVIAIEDWGFPVAILQYEDGVMWDDAITSDGTLPDGYQRLPTQSETAPTLHGQCDPDEHVFDVDPQKRLHDHAICQECRLSATVLMQYGADMNTIQRRLPHICHICEETLGVGEKNIFVEDVFLCPDCYENRWDEYAEMPVSELPDLPLVCRNITLHSITINDSDETDCGFWTQATPERTHAFLRTPSPGVQPSEIDSCPECGEQVIPYRNAQRLTDIFIELFGLDVGADATFSDVVAELGTDTGVLSSDELETFQELYAEDTEQRRRQRKQKRIQRTREESVFEMLPTEQLRSVNGKPTAVLQNEEPGCRVIGWPTFEEVNAQRQLAIDLHSNSEEKEELVREEHLPTFVVVQTRDGDPPSDAAVAELRNMNYTPLDGETGADRGGGGWPIETELGHEDSALIGAYVFLHVPPETRINQTD